jgi:hypothetical protein
MPLAFKYSFTQSAEIVNRNNLLAARVFSTAQLLVLGCLRILLCLTLVVGYANITILLRNPSSNSFKLTSILVTCHCNQQHAIVPLLCYKYKEEDDLLCGTTWQTRTTPIKR